MKSLLHIYIIVLLTTCTFSAAGQSILSTSISLDVNKQRLEKVLEIISNKANFYFSYNSRLVPKDSLVTIRAGNKTVKEVLFMLFNNSFEFKESGNYLIIRKAPVKLVLLTQQAIREEKNYWVTGYIYDEQTGSAINEASIYEKTILAAALSNIQGYFKLKLRDSKNKTAELSVSKEFYEDTSVIIHPGYNQQLNITLMPLQNELENVIIKPADYFIIDTAKNTPDTFTNWQVAPKKDSSKVEKRGLGKWLLSGKQKVQSLNLRNFFTTRPFQASLTPGLGSHGKLSSQVVNNFSLNALGGYTAGTNGLEIGGLFNIDKKEVKYVQVAGLFNSVGGRVKGLQIAGINNMVQDTVKAVQAAGVNNYVKGNMIGVQLAGVYNHVTDSVRGLQAAGVANFTRKKSGGVQLSGVANISYREMSGVQIAGVINYTKKLNGVQLGLINIADSSDGYSIGLINIVLNGYHKLSISTNEIMDVNAAFKTGNSKLYSSLQAGLHTGNSSKAYSFGYGIGSEIAFNKKKTISFNPEISSQYLYLGSWDYTNILNRANLNISFKLGRYISLFAGPSFSVFVSDQKTGISGYRFPVMPAGYQEITFSNKVTGWIGWNAGINFF